MTWKPLDRSITPLIRWKCHLYQSW